MTGLQWFSLFRETWASYQRHNAQWLAAALAYFAAFAVAPLIVVVVAIAGFFLHDRQHALNAIYQEIPGPGSTALRAIVTTTVGRPRQGLIAEVAGWAIFVLAAIGLFSSLQFALNAAWDVQTQHLGLWKTIRQRAMSFLMVAVAAGLLLLSILANTAINALSATLALGGGASLTLLKATDFALSFAMVWLLFAVLFEYLPDARVYWRDVWIGAGLTAALFAIGQSLLGWYLGRQAIASTYGAFGSLVAFLLWANYSAQIVLFGAEFTHVFAERHEKLQSS